MYGVDGFQALKSEKDNGGKNMALPKDQLDHVSDAKARAAGFLVGIPGELYILSVSRRADIFIEQISGVWTAYRSTYTIGKAKPIYSKTIATGETLDYVLMKAKGYTQYIDRFRQRKRK